MDSRPARQVPIRPLGQDHGPLRGRREDPDGDHRAMRRHPAERGPEGLGRPLHHQRRDRPGARGGRAWVEVVLLHERPQGRGHRGAHACVDGRASRVVFAALARDGFVEGDAVGGFEGKVKSRRQWRLSQGGLSEEDSPYPNPLFSGPTNGVRCQRLAE